MIYATNSKELRLAVNERGPVSKKMKIMFSAVASHGCLQHTFGFEPLYKSLPLLCIMYGRWLRNGGHVLIFMFDIHV